MKLAAFDIELAKGFPDNTNWQDFAPLGIACVAIAYSDSDKPSFWHGTPQMTEDECKALVREIIPWRISREVQIIWP